MSTVSPTDRQLDGLDRQLLDLLATDARSTMADLGRQVGLSRTAVLARVQRLERAGVIRGYRAVVAPEALGLYVTALVAATPLDPSQPDDLPDRVRGYPEVEDCFSVAGEANYILKVRVRTTSDLEELIRRLREKGGVQTRTTVVLSIPFENRPLAT
jgi:Lrp/AsnC family transcriptional regulator, leucine-responsive regulatory protein